MSNFSFLKENRLYESFANTCIEAENGIGINTIVGAIMCRRALELAVKWLYSNDNDLEIPYQDNLSALVHDITFKNLIDEFLLKQIEYIIKLGNFAVYNNRKISREEVILALNYLFNFIEWIDYCYSDKYIERKFDEKSIPASSINTMPLKERESLYAELESKDKKLEEVRKENIELRKRLTNKRESKKEKFDFVVKDISEFETRKNYIDLELKIAGWDFDSNMTAEYPVDGMPNSENKGFVDYVLFGENGLPVAVVEAKRTSKDSRVGKNQAKLYADCIEKEFHQRPVIYYTNGFDIYMWDDMNYSPRLVAGYYTQNELQLLINRRKSKLSLEHINIDKSIAGREYQLEAIKSVCEAFEQGHRKALLVMATGTGKTRTAISLVDVLSNTNWAKNVLFLADRTVLVNQAKNNFTKLLPNISTCNLLNSKENSSAENSRIIFSTYQTMMNAIDNSKNEKGNKLFTPGHFDLIIIDEAHRSIYNKYRAIFEYFDGLLVGLTATPRSDIDKNTYRFFEIENNVPTYVYEYDRAVKEGFLVNYHSIRTSTTFMDRGIKYDDLSEKDKETYEDSFADEEGNLPESISASAMNTWLFNRDTIKKLLELLMTKGLRVEGGDKIGKTIIFAKNHMHAQKIVDIFNEVYKDLCAGHNYIDLIDNTVNYHEDLINRFSEKDKFPQIAVSVDMLDTGVDVPEVLNLVFFKPVKSKIKFWQMIGRGTRLCKDIFGYEKDKEEFYIFDYCRNFEFFSEQENEIESPNIITLTEKIYRLKLDLIVELQNIKYQTGEYIEYRNSLIKEFLEQIYSLNADNFNVRLKKIYIDRYSSENSWSYISATDATEIYENIIPLLIIDDPDEMAKRFDNFMYRLQVKKIRGEGVETIKRIIVSTVEELEKLGTIPQVLEKKDLIIKVAEENYLDKADFWQIENIRNELRDLIHLIEKNKGNTVITIDLDDDLGNIDEDQLTISTGNNFSNYKKKLEKYLAGNINNIIVWKIRHNIRLSEEDKKNLEVILFEKLGNNSDYVNTYGDTNIIKAVRNIVGLDKETAMEIFSKYINDNRLNLKQIQFVKLLIDYVIKNGTIELIKLTEQPFSIVGQPGQLFEKDIDIFKEIRKDIDMINDNAEKLA